MAGGVPKGTMSIEEFEKQAEEYETGGTELDGLFKLLNLLGIRHPWHAQRFLELKRWAEDGGYVKILGGTYPLRKDDKQTSVYEEFRASARAYQDSFRDSKDPLIRTVRDIADEIGANGERLWDTFKKRFGGPEYTAPVAAFGRPVTPPLAAARPSRAPLRVRVSSTTWLARPFALSLALLFSSGCALGDDDSSDSSPGKDKCELPL